MTIPQPPPLRPRRSLRRAGLILGAFLLVGVVLLAALYLEENWRGAREFAAVRRDLAAKGESLDWRASIPPPVPDAQNLAMAPLFARELAYQVNPKTGTYTFGSPARQPNDWQNMPYGNDVPTGLKKTGSGLNQRPDLAGLQKYYRRQAGFPHPDTPGDPAADVLLALTRYGPELDELARAAAERPLTRFPIDYHREEFWTIALPQYDLEQHLVSTLGLRATAALADRQPEEALRDLELGLRLARGMKAEHLLIGHLVEITCVGLTLNRVCGGLADRRWTAAQIARLQTDLEGFDLLADFLASVRFERATGVASMDYMARHREMTVYAVGSNSPFDEVPFRAKVESWLTPRGWFDQTNALTCRFEQKYVVEAIDAPGHHYRAESPAEGDRLLRTMPPWPPVVFTRLVFPIWQSVGGKTARTQAYVDEAVTACALERFFLDHQAYPARLDELVPAYLSHVPTDVIDGAPLRYRPMEDGRFQVYAVGLNGRDDGGRVAWEKSGVLDDKDGDWVWQYAELQPPPPPRK